MFGRRSPGMVGVDIGTSNIKVVELIGKGSDIELVALAIEPTPAGCIQDGAVIDPPVVAEAVKRAVRKSGTKNRNVASGIAGQGVVVRHVMFPRMPEDELREALKWDGAKYIPFPVADAVIDVEIMDGEKVGSLGDQATDMEVMIVAAQKRIVDPHVETLELAGLKPVAIDIQPFTVLRALLSRDNGMAGSTAYLDIGAGTTDIVIAQGQRLRFTRIVQIGGNNFTHAISEKLGLSFDEAEEFKLSYGEVVPNLAALESVDDDRVRQASEAIYDVATDLVTEIRRSLDYHDMQLQGRYDESAVTKVITAGGGSMLKGLTRHIEETLGVPTVSGDPFLRIQINPRVARDADAERLRPLLPVAVGLALREVDGN